MSRLALLHEDCCKAADPDQASRLTRIGHKLSKTAWSIWDHKLPDKKTVAVMVGGAALSAGLAVVTGGASLAVQLAVAFAVGVGSGGIQKIVDHRNYRNRKAKISKAQSEEIEETRGTARMMHENLVYNEDHYIDTLAQLLEACKELRAYETTKQLNGEAQMKEFVKRVAIFWDRYERASHYFVQYEEYIRYVHKFADHARTKHDDHLHIFERYLEAVVKKDQAWHRANCRTSRFSKDICYGLSDDEKDVGLSLGGKPHNRVS